MHDFTCHVNVKGIKHKAAVASVRQTGSCDNDVQLIVSFTSICEHHDICIAACL